MTAEEIKAKAREYELEKERQHKKDFYKLNRERLLEKIKTYDDTHREEINERRNLYRNFDRVDYCKMMIKRWEKKLKEAEKEAEAKQ